MMACASAPAVPVKTARSVLLFVTCAAVWACSAPPKHQPAGSARPVSAPSIAPQPATGPATALLPPPAATTTRPPLSAEPSATAEAPTRSVSSAYPGCGVPIPPERLWDETAEGEVLDAITAAKACAAENQRHVLLEFVAPWCDDCREMARLDESSVVAETMKARFERVRVNVGKWDRHEGLRTSFDVHALATYVVLDPKTSKPLAKTTLEPITKKGKKLSAEDWARWLAQH